MGELTAFPQTTKLGEVGSLPLSQEPHPPLSPLQAETRPPLFLGDVRILSSQIRLSAKEPP